MLSGKLRGVAKNSSRGDNGVHAVNPPYVHLSADLNTALKYSKTQPTLNSGQRSALGGH